MTASFGFKIRILKAGANTKRLLSLTTYIWVSIRKKKLGLDAVYTNPSPTEPYPFVTKL